MNTRKLLLPTLIAAVLAAPSLSRRRGRTPSAGQGQQAARPKPPPPSDAGKDAAPRPTRRPAGKKSKAQAADAEPRKTSPMKPIAAGPRPGLSPQRPGRRGVFVRRRSSRCSARQPIGQWFRRRVGQSAAGRASLESRTSLGSAVAHGSPEEIRMRRAVRSFRSPRDGRTDCVRAGRWWRHRHRWRRRRAGRPDQWRRRRARRCRPAHRRRARASRQRRRAAARAEAQAARHSRCGRSAARHGREAPAPCRRAALVRAGGGPGPRTVATGTGRPGDPRERQRRTPAARRSALRSATRRPPRSPAMPRRQPRAPWTRRPPKTAQQDAAAPPRLQTSHALRDKADRKRDRHEQ